MDRPAARQRLIRDGIRGSGFTPSAGRMKARAAAIDELVRRDRGAGPPQPRPRRRRVHRDQVAYALAESRGRARDLVDLAQTLGTRLPGTAAALDDGTISRYKAEIITHATALLDDAGPAPPRTRSGTGRAG